MLFIEYMFYGIFEENSDDSGLDSFGKVGTCIYACNWIPMQREEA